MIYNSPISWKAVFIGFFSNLLALTLSGILVSIIQKSLGI